MKKIENNSHSQINQVEPHNIVYVDEAGFVTREYYPYDYSLRGERCYALKSGKRTERVKNDCGTKRRKAFRALN